MGQMPTSNPGHSQGAQNRAHQEQSFSASSVEMHTLDTIYSQVASFEVEVLKV